jgi:ERCC4-type nuclease
MATIILDSREHNGAIPYIQAFVSENNNQNSKLTQRAGGGDIQYLQAQLTVGDYSITLPVRGTDVAVAVFERKTWTDLAQSIKDGRAQSQHKKLMRLRKQGECHVYYIIEGAMMYADDKQISHMPFKGLHSKIRHNAIRGIPYIQTKSAEHTARTLVQFARDYMKLYMSGELCVLECMSDTDREEYMQCKQKMRALRKKYIGAERTLVPPEGSGESKCADAAKVPAELKRSTRKNSDTVYAMWRALPGVSDKTAAMLMEHYKVSDIVAANPDRYSDLLQAISQMQYPSGTKVGNARAGKILSIVCVDRDHRDTASEVKVLACIPGITKDTAQIIAEKFPLYDIFNGRIPDTSISELKKNNGKKIGMAATTKLLDFVVQV